jgi:SPP1 family predicted phage head-tail adaptor
MPNRVKNKRLGRGRDLAEVLERTGDRKTPSGEEQGGTGWEVLAKVRGKLEPISGREFFEARQAQEATAYRFVCRYFGSLDSHHFLRIDGHIYEIDAILDINNMHRELEIMCTRSTLGGSQN